MQRREGEFKGYDGIKLFTRSWIADNPVGTIALTHGLGEHSGSYERLAEGITTRGWTIHAWDLRGHGRSDGRRGVVSRFNDYSDDLALFIKSTGTPTVILGHSMGGLVTLRALLDHGTFGAKKFALSSPLLGIALEVPAIKKKAAKVLAKILPKLTLANEINYADLTSDPKVIEEYNRDKLRHDRTSSVLYLSMVENMNYVLQNASKIQLPALVQQAGRDAIVSADASRRLFEALGSKDKKWILYEGYKHEIFNETGRARVFEDLLNWLRS